LLRSLIVIVVVKVFNEGSYYRVTLAFWDDLAIVASEHVKKGDRIFVSGRLVSDTVDEGPEKRQVYYKVLLLP
jgi:single-stranded DNA-binding protein